MYRDDTIKISLDPGYDGVKVTAEGLTFDFPSVVVDITGKEENFIAGFSKKNYILSHYIPNRSHLLGEHAEMLILENDIERAFEEKAGMLDSYEKFSTQDSEITLITAIGMSLIRVSQFREKHNIGPQIDLTKPINEDSKLKIFVSVALPHDAVDKAWPGIKQKLVGRKQFAIETENGRFDLDFTIEEGHCQATSQVIDAFIGTIIDDNGNYYSEVEEDVFLTELPAVVIDGGFKTTADFGLTKNLMVENAKSEFDYSMSIVYKNVAKRIKQDYERDVKYYQLKAILKNDDGKIMVIDENDRSKEVDIKPLLEEEKRKIAHVYIEHICNKYNNLLNHKKLIIGGGTGAAFYPYFKEFIEDKRSHLRDKLVLTNYKFMGSNIDPVFAISVGQYKLMKKQLNDAITS